MFFQPGAQLLADRGVDERLDLGVAQLGLGLALELGFGDLDRDDRGQALAQIVARRRRVVLEDVAVACVGVEAAGQRGLERREVRAALDGVDVVGKREKGLVVGIVVLDRDLADQALRLVFNLEIDRRVEDDVLAFVQRGDEGGAASISRRLSS